MNPNVIELTSLQPAQLDAFLSLGWYRIQQTIFTTDFLYFDDQVYDAIWLRVRLRDLMPDKRYKILSKKNSCFRTEIKSSVITPAHEELYDSYKEGVSFEGASSLHSLLYGKSDCNAFNSQMINVFDGDVLIGAGVFDLGKHSAAGICSIYNPAYRKFSLGKYMIYEKIQYCKRENFTYFYPGYFVPGYPTFDYKLEIGKPAIDYFDPVQKRWFAFYKSTDELF
ncbi:MAG TPA: GNAT family N-acetyltransferase [Hanamia sp.]